MERLQKIYTRINQHKVELGAIDDFRSEGKLLGDLNEVLAKRMDDYFKLKRTLDDLYNGIVIAEKRYDENFQRLAKAVKELGVSIPELDNSSKILTSTKTIKDIYKNTFK
jgi:hypothetical protein